MVIAAIRKRYREEFERLGIDVVTDGLRNSRFDADKSEHAKRWLTEKADESRAHFDSETMSLMREQARAARSANRAAWIAAITAIAAAAIAIYSIPNFQTWFWRLFSSS
jgi:hypothetical protein